MNNSSPATAPSRATSAKQDCPAVCGIDINNGIRCIAEIEKSVRDGIRSVHIAERKSVLSMYRIAFRLAARGIEELAGNLKEEGQL